MIRSLKRIIAPLIVLFSLGFLIFLINQFATLFLFAESLHPALGLIVKYGGVVLFLGLLLYPLIVYFQFPKPLKRPKDESDVARYKKQLGERLSTNKLVKAKGIDPKINLEGALTPLDRAAGDIVSETATIVFLTTAVSQNGKLDAFTVLGTQIRMVWKIAHIYFQRPSFRDLAYLYANVAGSAFLANEIEDLDFSEQLEPITTAMLRNASGKAIPLLGSGANLIMDSLLEGSTNAFLTLRVGNIAKKYCGYPGVIDKRQLRKQAVQEAAKQLKQVAMNASGKVISGLASAVKSAGVDTIKSSWDGLVQTSGKVKDGILSQTEKINPFKKKEPLSEE